LSFLRFRFCVNAASAQENAAMVANGLAVHTEKYVSDRIVGTFADPSGLLPIRFVEEF
jgi:hypothetical protein